MKLRSVSARLTFAVLVGLFSTLLLAGCHAPLYYYSQYQFANRAIPPSGLQQRVLATFTSNGSGGGAEILDGLRDIRSNVQNTIHTFFISGYTGSQPVSIINFPEQQFGYILDYASGNLAGINYAKESFAGTAANYGAGTPSAAASPDGTRYVGATASNGQMIVTSGGTSLPLNLPNVYRVIMNPGNSVILAMTRNSNSLYRIIQLQQTNNPVVPPGSIDCEPQLLPTYCVVPVGGTYDRPSNAYFSLDGNTVYVLNCGPECGGTRASVSVLQTGALVYNNIPTVDPLSPSAPSPLATLPVPNPIPIPGGATAAVSDGTNLYLSGQSLFRLTSGGAIGSTPAADGLFTGYMTVVNQTSYAVSNPISISDGTHTRMLLADDDTLWIGSNHCATGERQATGQNYNCLTVVKLGSTPTAAIVPDVTPGASTTVPYPNTNGNQYYYGDLTGICWVQNYHKVYTAYGGQIHAFYTGGAITATYDPAIGTTPALGTEIDNTNITVQGTVLDVAYMDALTNAAN